MISTSSFKYILVPFLIVMEQGQCECIVRPLSLFHLGNFFYIFFLYIYHLFCTLLSSYITANTGKGGARIRQTDACVFFFLLLVWFGGEKCIAFGVNLFFCAKLCICRRTEAAAAADVNMR
ncbi:hypothetical protein FN846DRAFT_548915 [Sphaerosporella brunnea]|uniref:Uncharacterized protein n=1 Tax=Sphaerosporella brunnea TaxID=1250544 RepID=A0A5J5EEX2_9PEZI|nr:hypothetical protein FN846DRAFT_548915 [Sphaerosporella brunnea]